MGGDAQYASAHLWGLSCQGQGPVEMVALQRTRPETRLRTEGEMAD